MFRRRELDCIFRSVPVERNGRATGRRHSRSKEPRRTAGTYESHVSHLFRADVDGIVFISDWLLHRQDGELKIHV